MGVDKMSSKHSFLLLFICALPANASSRISRYCTITHSVLRRTNTQEACGDQDTTLEASHLPLLSDLSGICRLDAQKIAEASTDKTYLSANESNRKILLIGMSTNSRTDKVR
ncbi:unnamed protein product [Dicrocoelium dendriticum]|nr:unnamed protein product [Dicrocoelium dendriticum]